MSKFNFNSQFWRRNRILQRKNGQIKRRRVKWKNDPRMVTSSHCMGMAATATIMAVRSNIKVARRLGGTWMRALLAIGLRQFSVVVVTCAATKAAYTLLSQHLDIQRQNLSPHAARPFFIFCFFHSTPHFFTTVVSSNIARDRFFSTYFPCGNSSDGKTEQRCEHDVIYS